MEQIKINQKGKIQQNNQNSTYVYLPKIFVDTLDIKRGQCITLESNTKDKITINFKNEKK